MRKNIFILMVLILINNVNLSYVYGSDYDSISSIVSRYRNETITLEDLDQDTKQYFIESEKGKTPGIVIADFNGDGIEDLALLAKDNLSFFLCEKKGCERFKKIWAGALPGLEYIVLVKKGQVIEEIPGIATKSRFTKVRLLNAAVRLVVYGKGAVVYFWDRRKHDFESITTAD